MEPHYRAIIADDEPNLRRYLDRLLAEYWPQLEIVGRVGNGNDALDMTVQLQPDILFLDIRMPGLDGISLAKHLSVSASSPLIVFTTAYDQYAVDAFESEAIDYLLKPIDEDRLCKTIQKAKARLKTINSLKSNEYDAAINVLKQLGQLPSPGFLPIPRYLQWVKASQRDNIHLISVDDVSYFQAQDKYTSVVSTEGEYIIRTSIKELQNQLDPNKFWQIHRGILVQLSQIDKVKRDFSGQMYVYLKDGTTKLPVSRNSQALFKQM